MGVYTYRMLFHVRIWFAGVWTKSPAMGEAEACSVAAEARAHGDRAYVEDMHGKRNPNGDGIFGDTNRRPPADSYIPPVLRVSP